MTLSSGNEPKPILKKLIFALSGGAEIIFFLLFSIGCSGDSDIVATIGDKKITLDEFRQAYLEVLKQPHVHDSPDMREKFLDELINQYLFAEQARQKGLAAANDERLQIRLQAYRDKCLRDAHYRYMIKPQIKIDSSEIRQIYAYTRQQRKIRHLFCPDSITANRVYRLLEQGGDWNSLARELFADTVLARNGGDLGWVHWDEMEYDLAMTVFQLPLHTVSKPVGSTWGYHLLQVDDYQLDPLMSEEDYQTHYSRTRDLVEYKKGEKAAAEYVRKMMKKVKIRIDPGQLQKVGAQLQLIFTRMPKPFDQMNEQQLTNQEIKKVEDTIWDYRHEVLAIIGGQKMTIAQFAGMLNYIPYQALRQSLKTTLDYAIRDFVLTAEAKRLGLEKKDPLVQIKTDLFTVYNMQLEQRRDLLRNVSITDQEINSYFGKNNNPLFKNSVNDSIRELARQEILSARQETLLADTLQSLRKKYPVSKNAAIIHAYYNKFKTHAE